MCYGLWCLLLSFHLITEIKNFFLLISLIHSSFNFTLFSLRAFVYFLHYLSLLISSFIPCGQINSIFLKMWRLLLCNICHVLRKFHKLLRRKGILQCLNRICCRCLLRPFDLEWHLTPMFVFIWMIYLLVWMGYMSHPLLLWPGQFVPWCSALFALCNWACMHV